MGGNICRDLGGTVKQVSIRSSDNLILIYFDQNYGTGSITPLYFNVTLGNAAGFALTENPDFGNILHGSALTAQLTGKTVTMDLQGTVTLGMNVWLKVVEIRVNGS